MTRAPGTPDAYAAFEAGKQAAIDGKQASDNPYPAGSTDHDHWQEGFAFVVLYDEDGEIPADP